MDDVRCAISEMVTWDVDIIGLNEVHPDFFSIYDRTITSAFANMKFLGLPSGDAFVWRASCRLVSIGRVRGGSEMEWSGGTSVVWFSGGWQACGSRCSRFGSWRTPWVDIAPGLDGR